MELRMKESYGEGLANHTGPESYAVISNGRGNGRGEMGRHYFLDLRGQVVTLTSELFGMIGTRREYTWNKMC